MFRRYIYTSSAVVIVLAAANSIVCAQPEKNLQPREPIFDGAQAFYFLYKLVELGPRYPGSEAHEKARENIEGWFRQCGAEVRQQVFHAKLPTDPLGKGKTRKQKGINLIAQFGPRRAKAELMLCANYDTRSWCSGIDINYSDQPCPGANGNTSGVAILLELARVFAIEPPPIRVDLVVFDLEESGVDSSYEGWCKGSEFFAAHFAGRAPSGTITLNTVGAASPLFMEEEQCLTEYPEWTTNVFVAAHAAEPDWFQVAMGKRILGAHTFLVKGGIPTCAIVDQDYPYRHSHSDTAEQCNSETLHAIGRLLEKLIYVPVQQQ